MAGRWEDVATMLVAERGDALLRYATLVSGRPEHAADLVQDALVKTFSRFGSGFTVPGAEAYVRRTILTLHLDAGRRRSRWHRIAHLAMEPEASESGAAATEARLDLFRVLRTLTPRERACVVLRYYDDLMVDDIARELEISAGAVKRYLSDALHKLAVALTPPEGTTGSGPTARREDEGARDAH